MNDFRTDMHNSIEILRKATPVIMQLLNITNGKIIDVENQDNEACNHLDMHCGIDYLAYFKTNDWTRGIAWRAQPAEKPYNTFTIRKSRDTGTTTEFEKRKSAIENNALYPHYVVQAYYNSNKELTSIGISTTKDVIDCIEKGYYRTLHTHADKIGQAEFYVVSWDDLKDNGYNIIQWAKES